MKNIIITGGGMSNKGAQAMTLITANEIIKRYPDHKVYLYSPVDKVNRINEKEEYAFGFIGWYPLKFAYCQKNVILRLLNKLKHKSEFIQCEDIYRNCDAIIDISGYAIGSNWDKKICSDFLDSIEMAEGFGIPVYLMPQSFGPFDFGVEHKGIDERCRRLLPKCKLILAREKEGYDALVGKYGLTNVRLASDIVLNNKGIDVEKVFKNPPRINIPDVASSSIAIIPNGRNLSVGKEDEVTALYRAAVCRGLEQGKTVYLLHHATSDAKICTAIKEQFEDEDKVVLLSQEFSCLEFNELVKRFDYLVASRFHSIVHAFKNGVPCIALGWAKKYEDLLDSFGQKDFLLDVRRSPKPEEIAEIMNKMNASAKENTKIILRHLCDVQKENVFDYIDI